MFELNRRHLIAGRLVVRSFPIASTAHPLLDGCTTTIQPEGRPSWTAGGVAIRLSIRPTSRGRAIAICWRGARTYGTRALRRRARRQSWPRTIEGAQEARRG